MNSDEANSTSQRGSSVFTCGRGQGDAAQAEMYKGDQCTMVPCSPQPLDAPLTPVPAARLVPRLTSNPLGTLSPPSTACCAHDAASNVLPVFRIEEVFCKLSRSAAVSSSTGLRLYLSARILRAQESAAHGCPRLRRILRLYRYKLSSLASPTACTVRLMRGTRTTLAAQL